MQAEHEAQFQGFVRARWSRLVRTAHLLTGDSNTPGDGMYVSPRVRRRSGSVTVSYGDYRRTLP
ncbi:hypothetical protein [Streptomyces sp. UG1]|uniref:hypothetical protein n=1 Tax=Streptomyces sp. UG1 TaxID=3417652 RepID=UPI003CF887C8